MACKITYKNKTYTQADFANLMADPIFAAELEESLLTDIYAGILREFPSMNQADMINEVISKSGTTFTAAEIQGIINREAARRDHLNVGPVIQNNSIGITPRTTVKQIKQKMNDITFTGTLGRIAPKVVEALKGKEYKIEAAKNKAGKAVADLNRVFDKLGKQISEFDKLAVTNIIRGGGINAATALTLDGIKDPKLRKEAKTRLINIATAMNTHIKDMSLEIMQSGALSNVQYEIFLDNLGKYSLRAYKAYVNPESWVAQMRTEGTPAALALATAITEYKAGHVPKRIASITKRIGKIQSKIKAFPTPTTAEEKDQLEWLKTKEEKLKNELVKYNDMLINDDALGNYIMQETSMLSKEGGFKTSKLAIDMSSFKKKNQDLPQWYRDLLGEITDPIELYEATISKSASVSAAYSFQRAFALLGNGTIFSTKYDKEKGFTEKIDGSNYPGIVDQLKVEEIYIIPEAKAELIEILVQGAEISKVLAFITSWSNWNMTVGSVKTQEVNFFQAPMFMINNGNMSLLAPDSTITAVFDIIRELSTNVANLSVNAVSKDLGVYNSKTDFMRYLRDVAVENGVTNSSVDFENIKRLAERNDFKKANDWFENHSMKGVTVPYKVMKGIKNFLNGTYAESDNIIKLADFKVNLDRLSTINHNMSFRQLLYAQKSGKLTEEQVRRVVSEAALRTREMVPNYAEVYNIIKTMRKYPVVGTFSSFYGETIRTSVNTLRWAKKDYDSYKKTGNTQYLRWSMQKVMGVSTTAGLHMFFNTIGGAALLAALGGGDDDDEQRPESVEQGASNVLHRYCLPPYYSSAAFVKVGDGQYRMLNSESVNPYGGLYGSLVKMINRKKLESESTEYLVIESIMEFVGPILGISIQSEVYMQMLSGKDGLGRDISKENFTLNPTGYIVDVMGYGIEALLVPATLKERMKVLEISGKVGDLEYRISNVKEKELAEAKDPEARAKIQAEIDDIRRQIKYQESRIESANDAYLHFGFKTSDVDVRLTTMYKAKEFKAAARSLSSKVKKNLSRQDIIDNAKEDYYKILRDVQSMYVDVNTYLGVDISKSILDGGFSKEELKFITGDVSVPPDIPSEDLKVIEDR